MQIISIAAQTQTTDDCSTTRKRYKMLEQIGDLKYGNNFFHAFFFHFLCKLFTYALWKTSSVFWSSF